MAKKTRTKSTNSNSKINIGSIALLISRYLVAAVFIFSGFVKAIDPLGFTYKIEDYLRAFGGVFESFAFIAFPTAILLSTLELLIGLNLLFKVQIKITSILALLFMLIMTPLTLYIALKNPVTDCGCFGDALVISNWATFYKNVVLITLVIILLIANKKLTNPFTTKIQWIITVAFVGIGIGLSVYCYRHLPLIDFRPYKIGVNIPNAMFVPENAPSDKYTTTFIYKKNGAEKEFTLENYPKGDSTWKFVDQKSVLISKGFKAPIHDFTIVDAKFNDITEKVIYDKESTYLLVMYDLNQTSEEGAKKAEVIYQKALKSGISFYALTGSSDDDVKDFKQKTAVTFPFCKTDPITLKTIIRANPGLVFIKNGTIVNKWNWRDF
ncbi:MAG: BT_3928 family protein [Paludibacter sp.]